MLLGNIKVIAGGKALYCVLDAMRFDELFFRCGTRLH